MTTNNLNPVLPFNFTQFSVTFGCEYKYATVTSLGYFQGDNQFKHSINIIFLQLGTAIIMNTFFRRILRPLNQPRFVSEMLTAIILGPSVMQHFNKKYDKFFQDFYTPKQTAIMTFIEFFSTFVLRYLIGIQTDLNVMRTSGKLGWILGISGFVLPNLITKIVSNVLAKYHLKEASLLQQTAIFAPITSFHVIVILLQDVKLLNSEIGRLAISSSIISNTLSWLFTSYTTLIMFGTMFQFTTWDYIKSTTPKLLFILFAAFGIRPILHSIMKKIPEGKTLKQWQFVAMIMMLFFVGFYNESLGYSADFGSMVLGMAVPTGPPIGSGVIEKASLFVWGVLIPSYLLITGHFVNVFLVKATTCWIIVAVTLCATIGKIFAAVVPMKIFGVPNKDAIALGLILSSQGLFDVIIVKSLYTYSLINQEYFTVITLMITLNAFICTPILMYIYDPSKRYINYKRRTIQHSRHETEFKTLVCIHEEDDVFGLLKVLIATNPTKKTPIAMYALDLIELVGRMTPIFINHQFHKKGSNNRTDRILNSFKHFEALHEGVKRYNFTAIAPYNSMHDEICTLALTKSVSFLVIPFHKFENVQMRGVKRQVLDKAPCSIGILVDKKIILSRNMNFINFHVCVVFLGGCDSREALAYAMHMMENPLSRLTVIRLIAEDEFVSDIQEIKLDMRAIAELKSRYGDEGHVEYEEVIVRDGVHTIEVLRSINGNYDLILVGRRLDAESPLVAGLADWTYEPELGIVGDVLGSADMKSSASVLVIQQQSTVEDMLNIDRAKKLA